MGQGSQFLLLPRELRDLICQFSLSEPNGLYCYKPPAVSKYCLYTDPHCSIEFNQLKHVCKQLYDECMDLEFKFNGNITLPRTAPVPPETLEDVVTSFLSFSASLHPRWHARLRTVKLQQQLVAGIPYLSFTEETLKPLVQYCYRNPATRVELEVPGCRFQSGRRFVLNALHLLEDLRTLPCLSDSIGELHATIGPLQLALHLDPGETDPDQIGRGSYERSTLTNLRFMPQGDVFDEIEYHKFLRAPDPVNNRVPHYWRNLISEPQFLRIARRLYEKGL